MIKSYEYDVQSKNSECLWFETLILILLSFHTLSQSSIACRRNNQITMSQYHLAAVIRSKHEHFSDDTNRERFSRAVQSDGSE